MIYRSLGKCTYFIWLRSYDVLQLQQALALMHYSDKFEYIKKDLAVIQMQQGTRLRFDRVKP